LRQLAHRVAVSKPCTPCQIKCDGVAKGGSPDPSSDLDVKPPALEIWTRNVAENTERIVARRQNVLLILIVCLPLALVAWLGWRLSRTEQLRIRRQFHDVFAQQLKEIDGTVVDYFQEREREFVTLLSTLSFDPTQIREKLRREPRIRQIFVLNPNGTLLHPRRDSDLSDSERQFLMQASQVIIDRDLVRLADRTGGPTGVVQKTPDGARQASSPAAMAHGWYTFYWGRGLQLIFWHRRASGHITGILVERSRCMADLIAELPETQPTVTGDDLSVEARVRLLDSNANVVYQWGQYEPTYMSTPFVDRALSHPLSSWRLQYLIADDWLETSGPGSTYFNIVLGITVSAIALILLVRVFYREYAREIREATQRVNFVNQVSHELKTPLTNIRMYADLLERDLENIDPVESGAAPERIKVIVAESQRLSRLITNVLTFARQQRDQATVRPAPAQVDPVILSCLERPVWDRRGIEVHFDRGAASTVNVDVDALEQILVNLLSNVEKYAVDSRHLEIISRQQNNVTTIVVADDGPGIPPEHRSQIFQPFYRAADSLEDAPGTGIGLAIARQLARLHGGDLVLQPSDTGSRFCIELHTPTVDDGDVT